MSTNKANLSILMLRRRKRYSLSSIGIGFYYSNHQSQLIDDNSSNDLNCGSSSLQHDAHRHHHQRSPEVERKMLSETNSNLIRWWWTTIGSLHSFEPTSTTKMMATHSTSTKVGGGGGGDHDMSTASLPTTVLASTSTASATPAKPVVGGNGGDGAHVSSTSSRSRHSRQPRQRRRCDHRNVCDGGRSQLWNVSALTTLLIITLLSSCFGGCWAHLISVRNTTTTTTTTNSIDTDSRATAEQVTSAAAATITTTTTTATNEFEDHMYRALASTPAPSSQLSEPQNLIIDHSPVQFDGQEYRCSSMKIRSVANFQQLKNCTVIEGHLVMVMINENGMQSSRAFQELSFPRLREITDYFIIFRVSHLKSLARLFPNLAVIRGRQLMHNYALVIYEMFHLEEVGLQSLTNILRGGVMIRKNPMLCFVSTIDWHVFKVTYRINSNKEPKFCPTCSTNCSMISAKMTDGTAVGDRFGRLCWSPKVCQRHYCATECDKVNSVCSDRGDLEQVDCCPSQCLGGCRTSANGTPLCRACSKFYYKGECHEKCPPGTYAFFDRRCVTREECIRQTTKVTNQDGHQQDRFFKAVDDICDIECKPGYLEDPNDPHNCIPCDGFCPKVCISKQITNIASAQELKGCTTINGSLEILLKGGGRAIVRELEESLEHLRVITGYLKVARSFPLISLNFLKNLEQIRGDTLDRDAYSLIVMDNPNLQDLWTFSPGSKRKIDLVHGRIFAHINPLLCYSRLKAVTEYMHTPDMPSKWDDRDVSTMSNGDRAACEMHRLSLSIERKDTFVVATWNDFRPYLDDQRSLLGYLVYYRETNGQNVSIYDGRDACFADDWSVIEVQNTIQLGLQNKTENNTQLITNLKPYTQYAIYVKTYMIAGEKKGAQSDMIYFRMPEGEASKPRSLEAKARSPDSITVTWLPPLFPNGNVTHYRVEVFLHNNNNRNLYADLDYCQDPNLLGPELSALAKQTSDYIGNVTEVGITTTTTDKPVDMEEQPKSPEECCTCSAERVAESTSSTTKRISTRNYDEEHNIDFEDSMMNSVFVKNPLKNESEMSPEELKQHQERLQRVLQLQAWILAGNVSRAAELQPKLTARDKRNVLAKYLLDASVDDSPSSTTESSMVVSDISSTPTGDPANHTQDSKGGTTTTMTTTTAISTALKLSDAEPDKKESPEILFKRLVSGYEVVVPNLTHYTAYRIQVVACQHRKSQDAPVCSQKMEWTVASTLAMKGADDIDPSSIEIIYDVNITMKNNGVQKMRMHWNMPANPNGQTVAYEIEVKRVDDGNKLRWTENKPICLNNKDYLLQDNGTAFNLTAGNYTVRLRTRSVADFGSWTEPKYIYIEEPIKYNWIIYFLISVVITLFVGIAVFYVGMVRGKLDYVSVNPEYYNSNAYKLDEKWEVNREDIHILKELGHGSFGMVYEGEIINNGVVTRCAIKTVKEGADKKTRYDFLNEAQVMKSFTDCNHVMKLLGIVSIGSPCYVLMEIMPLGDLRNYLRRNRPDSEDNPNPKPLTTFQLYKIATEIADGMAYLSSKRFVHRDLAARNCMVAADLTVKIGDFGMTRDVYEHEYYRKGTKGLLPVRWMSPESLNDGLYTHYSDCWSYGVVLWEMCSGGAQPYAGLSNEQVYNYIKCGGHLIVPPGCSPVLGALMRDCWKAKPRRRPTFFAIIQLLLPHLPDPDLFLQESFYQRWLDDPDAQAAHRDRKGSNTMEDPNSLAVKLGIVKKEADQSGDLRKEDTTDIQFFPVSSMVANSETMFDDLKPEDNKVEAVEEEQLVQATPEDQANGKASEGQLIRFSASNEMLNKINRNNKRGGLLPRTNFSFSDLFGIFGSGRTTAAATGNGKKSDHGDGDLSSAISMPMMSAGSANNIEEVEEEEEDEMVGMKDEANMHEAITMPMLMNRLPQEHRPPPPTPPGKGMLSEEVLMLPHGNGSSGVGSEASASSSVSTRSHDDILTADEFTNFDLNDASPSSSGVATGNDTNDGAHEDLKYDNFIDSSAF